MLQLIILIITALVNLLLGLFVVYKNSKSTTNRMFFALTTTFALWSIITYISTHPILLPQLMWIRGVLFAAAMLNLFLYLTFDVFPNLHFQGRQRWRRLAVAATVVVAPLTLTPAVFKSLEVASNGTVSPVPAPGIVLFMLQTIALLGGGIVLLVRRFLRAQGLERQQLKNLLIGVLVSFILIISTNLFAVVLFHVTSLVALGPAFTIFFSGFAAYTIVRQRLFDIRAVVARSVAYALLSVSLAGGYALVVFGISNLLFESQQIGLAQNLFYAGVAVILAFTFQPLQRFFEKLTDRLFYRDHYDSQAVLNQLGSVLASQIDINVIIKGSLDVLCESLKPIHARLIVLDEDRLYRQAEYGKPHLPLNEKALLGLNSNLLITDELEQPDTRRLLSEHDISVSLRLKTQEGIVGYLLLGPKQNGSIYVDQDVRLLEIISNELAIAIENARSFEKIADFNATLQERIKEATKRLAQQNKRLQELDAAKDEFISMASHQLRTPLTAVKGYLSMLMEGDAGKLNQKEHDFADLAFTSAERMVYLISDMLNVSRVQTGKLVIERAPVDLQAVIASEIKQLERTAQAHGVKITFTPPRQPLPKLNLDEGKMRQVIMNFLDNAIYYAPNSTVEVALEQASSGVRLTVKDHGIGVPKAEQKKLFVKFFRAGNAQKQRPDGTGLGLYMAKMVVELQGGSIIFSSTEGKGSTFGFEFPLSALKVDVPPKTAGTPATPPVPTVASQSHPQSTTVAKP